jgi:ribosomal protein S6--L-glutamate ligase
MLVYEPLLNRPENTWKTNVAQGAKVGKASVDTELNELSIKAVKALRLDYAGVDVGETKDGYMVYEVNVMPNWQGVPCGNRHESRPQDN